MHKPPQSETYRRFILEFSSLEVDWLALSNILPKKLGYLRSGPVTVQNMVRRIQLNCFTEELYRLVEAPSRKGCVPFRLQAPKNCNEHRINAFQKLKYQNPSSNNNFNRIPTSHQLLGISHFKWGVRLHQMIENTPTTQGAFHTTGKSQRIPVRIPPTPLKPNTVGRHQFLQLNKAKLPPHRSFWNGDRHQSTHTKHTLQITHVQLTRSTGHNSTPLAQLP